MVTLTLALSVCGLATAYESYDIRQYEPLFTIKTEKIERSDVIPAVKMIIWYKVTNNSDKDFSDVDFICTIFKKDGTFFQATQRGIFNVRHGHSEYAEEDVMNLEPDDFGRAPCRLAMLRAINEDFGRLNFYASLAIGNRRCGGDLSVISRERALRGRSDQQQRGTFGVRSHLWAE